MSVKRIIYAKLLRAVWTTPKTVRASAAEAGCSRRVARILMARMHSLRLVHIAGWCQSAKGPMAAKWQVGDGPDAPRPICKCGKTMPMKERLPLRPSITGVDAIYLATLIRALAEPQTAASLRQITGRHPTTIYATLRALRAAGIAHVCDWTRERERGDWAPHWRLGIDKPDAPRPQRLSLYERGRRYRTGRKKRDETLQIVHALAANANHFTEAA